MASLSDITIKVQRRQVGCRLADGSERLGFFHKWSYDTTLEKDFALVEMPNGKMEYFNVDLIRFLPIENEIPPHELEEIYHRHGFLKG